MIATAPRWTVRSLACVPMQRTPTVNLMPALLDAVHAYATLGEIVDALADVFGRWTEDPRI